MPFLSNSQTHSDDLHLQVIVPVVGAIFLILTIVCLLVRRKRDNSHRKTKVASPIMWLNRLVLIHCQILYLNTVEEEYAIQTDLFVYTRFNTRNICSK